MAWPKELYGPPPFVVLFLRPEGAMRPWSIASVVAQSPKGCAISSKARALSFVHLTSSDVPTVGTGHYTKPPPRGAQCNGDYRQLPVQDNAKKRAIYLQPAVIVDEAKLSELVHEEIHS